MNPQLPVPIMEKALNLRNCERLIFIELFKRGIASTSSEIAQIVGHERAYVNMRLQQLVDRGYVKCEQRGKTKYFEVI